MKYQKHFRKIPPAISAKAKLLNTDMVVACVKKIAPADLPLYSHLGLSVGPDGSPLFMDRALPSEKTGRYSRWNLVGREIVRRDLRKIDKTFVFEVPNFGDWSKGTHDVYQIRKVYPREFVPPKQLEISVARLDSTASPSDFVLRFRVEEVLNPQAADFEENLFFNLNLLQENTGAADVYAVNAVEADYVTSITVAWDILPPGTRDDVLPKLLGKFDSSKAAALRTKLIDRYDFLRKFNPIAWVAGKSGFQRYFGALIREDLVVFENLDYGNAVYVMFENWRQLSQSSRLDLLKSQPGGFIRVVHRYGWEKALESVIITNLREAA